MDRIVLVIQDPTNEQSTSLLELLVDACRSAEQFTAAFAYATASGVQLLTGDETFRSMAGRHPVDLIVGIDAVTDIRALDALTTLSNSLGNVSVRAFLNPQPENTFHPKFSWTKNPGGGQLVVGSGNLTASGLLSNWEAYWVEQLSRAEIGSIETTWKNWVARHVDWLRPLDDGEVRERAAQNRMLAREGDWPTLVAPRAAAIVPTVVEPLAAAPAGEQPRVRIAARAPDVLIAEISMSEKRWKQANFIKDDYENFFGARVGERRIVVFRHVNQDGSLAGWERDHSVEAASGNWRFELGGAAGLSGRLLGVFVQTDLGPRTFLYRLLDARDPDYATIARIIQEHAGDPRGTRLRQVRMSLEDLRREWPDAPFWSLPDDI